MKPTPIKEGSTKSNVKKSDGKGRQSPPPPAPPKSREVHLFGFSRKQEDYEMESRIR
jgi:hypothetical protein